MGKLRLLTGGESHGPGLTAVLEGRTPLVNVAWALNLTVSGVVAHQSAMNDGERIQIPQTD